jgi:hypothetical protein
MDEQEGAEREGDAKRGHHPQEDGKRDQEPDPPPIAIEHPANGLLRVRHGSDRRGVQPEQGFSQVFLARLWPSCC